MGGDAMPVPPGAVPLPGPPRIRKKKERKRERKKENINQYVHSYFPLLPRSSLYFPFLILSL